jgi:hypothetical protein
MLQTAVLAGTTRIISGAVRQGVAGKIRRHVNIPNAKIMTGAAPEFVPNPPKMPEERQTSRLPTRLPSP